MLKMQTKFYNRVKRFCKSQSASVAQASNVQRTIVFIKDDELRSDTSFFNIYLNNVDSYGNHIAFTKNDILLKEEVLQKLQLYQQYQSRSKHIFR